MSFDIPFLGKPSCQFYKNISRLILKVSNVNVMLIYGTFKVGDYFKLKYPISLLLVSDVVYRFTCPCDTDETYRVYQKDIHPPYSQTGNRYDQTI